MAQKTNTTFTSFINGEWSPNLAARTESEEFQKSLAWCQNFIVLPQGGITKRAGTFAIGLTKNLGTYARLIPFQFSANDAIMIVATDSVFRYYRNNAVILNNPVTVSGISQANPGIVTATAHGFTNGQEVYIEDAFGMSQVNNRFFLVAGATTNTFTLQDQFGNAVSTTAYFAYASGGTVSSIYETATPYVGPDLLLLRTAQIGDEMYIVHNNYAPEKLVRSGFTDWSIGTFARTNDPFSAGVTFSITGITRANPGVVTVASTTGLANGSVIQITNMPGGSMKDLNNNAYIVQGLTGTTFQLYDTNNNPLNTTGFHAWSSGGVVNLVTNFPGGVCFTADGRLLYVNSRLNSEGAWASRLPVGNTTRYDDFTTSTIASDAWAFDFSPVNGILDTIQEVKQFGGMLVLLGASSIRQVFGSAPNLPPNINSVNTIPTIQGSAHIEPATQNWTFIFVDVNQKKLRGLQFNFYYSSYEAADFSQTTPHFGLESPFIKVVHVKGQPEIIWVLREDGVLLSFTFDNVQKVAAWARHYVGGGGQVIDIATIRNTDGDDQLWLVVERTLNGVVYPTIEVMSAWPNIPLKRAFFTGNQQSDLTNWSNAAWESLKESTYLDGSLTYDGAQRGNDALATLTLSANTGSGITVTSSVGVFQASDVNSEIWEMYNSGGVGGGRARIIQYVSATEVIADVWPGFNFVSTSQVPGNWRFAVNQLTNLQLYNGVTVDVQADGGKHPSLTVVNGAITLEYLASVIQVGFMSTSLAITQNIDAGTRSGPGNSKPRNIKRVRPRVDNTIGLKVGTCEYDLQDVIFRLATQAPSRVPDPRDGVMDVITLDTWGDEVKQVALYHRDPTPCTVLGVDIEVITNEIP